MTGGGNKPSTSPGPAVRSAAGRRKPKGPRTIIEELYLPFADPDDVVEIGDAAPAAEANVIPLRGRVSEEKVPAIPNVEREPNQRARPNRTPMPGTPPGSRRRPPPTRPRLRQLPRIFSTPGVARAPAARSSTRFTERSALAGIDASEHPRWLEIAGIVVVVASILIWILLA